eukprot:Nk52_evm9s283 gene=Nk52_evmTU9s283
MSIPVPPSVYMENIRVGYNPSNTGGDAPPPAHSAGGINNTQPGGVNMVLNGVDGVFPSARMYAILGSSGSGKTTLLNRIYNDMISSSSSSCLLAACSDGRIRVTPDGDDEVVLNGNPFTSSELEKYKRSLKNHIGYVEQTEILPFNLTPREILTYSALLRTTAQERNSIKSISHQKQPWPIRKALIDAKSEWPNPHNGAARVGGQVKRLGIALELVTSPVLLFVDEPTTGLDSRTAFEVVQLLRKVCLYSKVTIICTIHQPSSVLLDLFHGLLVLSHNGTCIYSSHTHHHATTPSTMDIENSPVQEAIAYFSSHPDVLNAMLKGAITPYSGTDPGSWILRCSLVISDSSQKNQSCGLLSFDENDTSHEQEDTFDEEDELGFVSEVRYAVTMTFILTKRCMRERYRDFSYWIHNFFLYLVMALIFASVYYNFTPTSELSSGNLQKTVNFLFLCVVVYGFAINHHQLPYVEGRYVYIRERAKRTYSPLHYCLAMWFASLPVNTCNMLVHCICTYFITGLRLCDNGASFFVYFLVLWLIQEAGSSVATCLCCVFPNFDIATLAVTIVVGLGAMFGGYFVAPLTAIPVFWQWAPYISYFWYGFQALGLNEFDHESSGEQGKTAVAIWGFGEDGAIDSVWGNILALLAFVITFRIIAFLGLKHTKFVL